MIETIATIDILNLAVDQLDEGRTLDCKDTLITYRDKLQKEVDEFDEWAKTQSDIHTSLELESEGK
jgi:N12 class adenine-specific DNA methylase